jgi:dimethylamine--corrinoid protein Co-methyltransferase
MSNGIFTRMGDGERIEVDEAEVRKELLDGTKDAAKKGKIPELGESELDQLFEIIAEPGRIVSLPHGEELIVTDDGIANILGASEADGGAGIPMDSLTSVLGYERGTAADTAGVGHEDYSFKPVKAVIDNEMQSYYTSSMSVTIPLIYGAQPNLGLYFQPDGPYPNASELLPLGKIDEARKAQEDAAEAAKEDMIYVGKKMNEMGCEGLNFDTAGSSGDADLYATLEAVRELKQSCPNMYVIVGMSSEFVLGMHGQITFDGQRLAGMFPNKQVKIVEAAGADIFGVAVNTNTSKTVPWNLSKAVTFVKNTVEEASIPVHPNVGMGVCGIPMMVETPIDCVTRTAKALRLVGNADGL